MSSYKFLFLLGISCLAHVGLAQNDEAAAIIQTSIMQFRVTGQAAQNFSQNAQTDFSNNLRTLLGPFNFMSVAVSDYQVCLVMLHLQIDSHLQPFNMLSIKKRISSLSLETTAQDYKFQQSKVYSLIVAKGLLLSMRC